MSRPPDDGARSARRLRRITIVGAGLAALRTAASLREGGFRGEITVLGAEGLPPYDRPPLSKELFTRTEPAWLSSEFGADLFALADHVELAEPARSLSPAESAPGVRIGVSDGAEIVSDIAVVATGAHAWAPPDWSGALLLHTAADAAALRSRLVPGTRLVCIGAGWIGAEISGFAADEGCDVTVLEQGPAPLCRELGAEVGALTAPWYALSGVDLHLDARVTSVHPDVVHVADGRRFAADVILAAVGARPTTAWLSSALPLTPRGAIAVDRVGRVDGKTGAFAPGSVRAVGDCADRVTERDGLVLGGHWASALHDPSLVATDILGGPLPASDPARYTFSTQHGHQLALFGQPAPEHHVVLRGEPRLGPWTALYVLPRPDLPASRGVLVAGLAVDAPRDVSALRRLLGGPERRVLDLDVAADPERSLRDAAR